MAVQVVHLSDVCQNLIAQCNSVVGLELVTAAISLVLATNPFLFDADVTQDDKDALLKAITGCTVALDVDLNCYPRGYDTALCFDLDGNPVP